MTGISGKYLKKLCNNPFVPIWQLCFCEFYGIPTWQRLVQALRLVTEVLLPSGSRESNFMEVQVLLPASKSELWKRSLDFLFFPKSGQNKETSHLQNAEGYHRTPDRLSYNKKTGQYRLVLSGFRLAVWDYRSFSSSRSSSSSRSGFWQAGQRMSSGFTESSK